MSELNATEVLKRISLGEESQLLYADEIPVLGTTSADLDFQKLSAYLQRDRNASLDEVVSRTALPVDRLLENLGLLKNGSLTLAALLLFGKTPLRFRPAFCVKAVSYVGNDRTGTVYRDSEDIAGDLETLYERTMSFLTRNLHHVQGSAGFNSIGTLEVSYAALEETVVNMLIHRDYFISAPWRVFIFDDRIELVSPGSLPNHLTIENVKNGISNLRNPLLASFATKMLPYRGMGTGIMRTLQEMPNVEIRSDRDAGEFTVVIPRNTAKV